jgi:BASS family bile acid:Na+ symporter
VDEILHGAEIAIRLSVVLFMVGNLLALGLETDAAAALAPLRDARFVAAVMVVDWLFGPALAIAIVRTMPMAEPYATGLLLISLAPAAPFLPAMVAQPLLLMLVLPMAAGMALRARSRKAADRLLAVVRPLANAATVLLLVAIVIRYFQGFIGAVGSFAIAGQILYSAGLAIGGWLLAMGLAPAKRSVISLGACTRNLGAALAPLLVTDANPRTMVMIALGVPVTLVVTYGAAGWLRKQRPA